MKKEDISTAIIAAYGDLFKALAINKDTGILGTISNKRYSNRLGKIRFSGYPFIGSHYSEASPKILVVGLDIGQDEKYQENTYHNLNSRNKRIEPMTQGENKYDKHMSGTYGIVIYLLKDYYGWSDVWNGFFEGKNQTFKTIVNEFGSQVLPYDVLSYVAFTNVHKFVTVGRVDERSGGENRVWYNPEIELEFFMREVQIFSPDIIYIQGQSSFDRELLTKLKRDGYKIVLGDHPSSWRNGANKPTYVDKLSLINW